MISLPFNASQYGIYFFDDGMSMTDGSGEMTWVSFSVLFLVGVLWSGIIEKDDCDVWGSEENDA